MDYQDARRIRKTGLLSLIAEGYFEDNKSLKGAVGGSVSDKFKAKAVGIKESLDPLNWVRKITGEGVIGDVAVTGLGRLFGRSDKSIQAFGGYGRRKKNKKDPNFTTINSGPIRPLKTGDSFADVLGKMYNFMQKSEELHKLNQEIEEAFRKEQLDEDAHRHEELVKAIRGFTKNKKTATLNKKENNEDEGSFLESILGGLKTWALGLLSKILSFVEGVAGLLGAAGLLDKLLRRPPKPAVPKVSTPKGKSDPKLGGPKSAPTPGAPPKGAGKSNKPWSGGAKKSKGKTYKKSLKKTPKATPTPSTAQKVVKGVKTTGGAALRGAKGIMKLINALGKFNIAFQGTMASMEINNAIKANELPVDDPNHIDDKELQKRIIKSFGGLLGGLAGGAIGGAVGAMAAGVGAWPGAILGGMAGNYAGEELAEKLYDFFMEQKDAVINEKLNKLTYANTGGGAAMGGLHIEKNKPVVSPKKDVSSKITPTPPNNQLGLSPGESVVAVNNTTNNVGGKKPKIIQTESAAVRNKDMNTRLRQITMAV